jgi:hypothetical protein
MIPRSSAPRWLESECCGHHAKAAAAQDKNEPGSAKKKSGKKNADMRWRCTGQEKSELSETVYSGVDNKDFSKNKNVPWQSCSAKVALLLIHYTTTADRVVIFFFE